MNIIRIPDDAWTLAWRAAIAGLKLVPVKTDPAKSETPAPLPRAAARTLQDDLDDKIVRLDELFWEDGTPVS
jgi:hypothetical protein